MGIAFEDAESSCSFSFLFWRKQHAGCWDSVGEDKDEAAKVCVTVSSA